MADTTNWIRRFLKRKMATDAVLIAKARDNMGKKVKGVSMAEPSERASSAEEMKTRSENPPPSNIKTGTKKSKDHKRTAASK
jgi:hypothetical protein